MVVKFNKKQKVQEDEYIFPYHYLDIKCDDEYLYGIEYLDYMRVVRNKIPNKSGTKVLDAGCGDGRFCYELRKAKENVSVYGVDYSQRAIDFAKAFNPNTKFFVSDLTKLNLGEKFDYIVLIETLEHIIPKDIPKILDNISNHLKPNGKFIITVPSKNLKIHDKHYQHFDKESLTKTLSPHFKVEKIEGYSKLGLKRTYFKLSRQIAFVLYPFTKKIKALRKIYVELDKFYQKHLSIGDSDKCRGVLAICSKKK